MKHIDVKFVFEVIAACVFIIAGIDVLIDLFDIGRKNKTKRNKE